MKLPTSVFAGLILLSQVAESQGPQRPMLTLPRSAQGSIHIEMSPEFVRNTSPWKPTFTAEETAIIWRLAGGAAKVSARIVGLKKDSVRVTVDATSLGTGGVIYGLLELRYFRKSTPLRPADSVYFTQKHGIKTGTSEHWLRPIRSGADSVVAVFVEQDLHIYGIMAAKINDRLSDVLKCPKGVSSCITD